MITGFSCDVCRQAITNGANVFSLTLCDSGIVLFYGWPDGAASEHVCSPECMHKWAVSRKAEHDKRRPVHPAGCGGYRQDKT